MDGVRGDPAKLSKQIGTHECAGAQRDGCRAAPARALVVERNGETQVIAVRPVYDGRREASRAWASGSPPAPRAAACRGGR